MDMKKKIAKLGSILLVADILICLASRVIYEFVTAYTPKYITAMAYTYSYYALFVLVVFWGAFHLGALKEVLRKCVVSLKRKPSMIPLGMMLIAFLYYSLNLTDISDTTALIQGKGMGLSQFCIMLLSMLCMLCMLNAFPHRKKPNIPMLVLVFAMFALLLYCDTHYLNCIYTAVNRAENPIKLNGREYIVKAYDMLVTHRILLIVTAVLTATLPLYAKLIRRIKTSVAVEDNGHMDTIEIDEQ